MRFPESACARLRRTLPGPLLHTDGGRVNRSASYDSADSYREFRHPLAALVLAVVTAGALDAFAFLRYGAFVANQSGNAIFLGMGPAGGQPTWPVSAASIVAFATAAGLVNLLRRRTRPTAAPLVDIAVTEAAMVVWTLLNLALAYGRHGTASRVLLAAAGAVAMGSLTTVATRTAGIATPITYQSGTTTKIGERAARWLFGPAADRGRARRGTLLGLLALVSYSVGGAVGTLAQHQPRWVPLWGTLALAVLILLLRRHRRPGPTTRPG
ncbi:YoaK family protein [Micromonospora aurantiaca]|uniref:YoaK family protein n=1 Tax=Micromonospora aurantiaca (nom. illeg.) TaxID=47850 RepID=UPI0038112755